MMNFYNSFTFIISFMVLVLFFQMGFGSKFVEYFLLLVLASMLILNANKLQGVFAGISKEE